MTARLMTDSSLPVAKALFHALCAQEDYDTHVRLCDVSGCADCDAKLYTALALRDAAFSLAGRALPALGIARAS